MQLQLPNVIAFIGSDLAQVLTLSKNFGVALSVLNEAEAAFVKLQNTGGLQHITDLRRSIQEPNIVEENVPSFVDDLSASSSGNGVPSPFISGRLPARRPSTRNSAPSTVRR
jgi:hypothetical protein